MPKITKKNIYEFAQLIAGNAICAFAMACFALPFDMVVSGVSGIGRIVNNYTGINIALTAGAVNIILFAVGALVLGRKFAATIAVGTFAYPMFLGLFQSIGALQHLVDDPLLAAICAGILDGVGLGLVLRIGGSTGGIDVPAIILNRVKGWNTATVLSGIDIFIFLIQLPITKSNGIILGILYALIYSVVMNQMILLEQGGTQMMIWSEKSEEVNETLLKLGYGTTMFKAVGGYMRDERDVICCATSNRTLHRAKRAVLDIDGKAFMTITSVSEVNGNGFTLMLPDEEYIVNPSERHDGLWIEEQQSRRN